MKALVTGASGMLGSDLCPLLEDFGYEVIETNSKTLDIKDEFACIKRIEEEKPDIIFHLAAYTKVELAEEEKEEAFQVNGKGTENLAKIAGKKDVPIVYVSTDYVFDGSKNEPYEVDDKPCPINVYGSSKLAGEEAIRKYCKKFYIARTSWLYGIHGKNFVDTMLKLKDKEELKVVDDQIGTPTWTGDLASAIIKIIDMPYGVYHLTGGGKPVSWHGFAKKIFELSENKVNLIPISSEEFKSKVNRPKYSVLNNNKMLRNWELALKDFLKLYL